jgi:hypothetical protein
MATATQVREATGASSRGKLPAGAIAEWNTAHPDDPYEPGPPRDGFTGNGHDYPDDGFDDLFDAPDGNEARETPPRRPRTGAKAGAKRPAWMPGGKAKPKGKPKPRVSTEDLIGSAWRLGAKLLMPLPPLHRVVTMQSRVAGPLLDDAVKGTIIDPVLQPLARLGDAGKTIQALVGPPVFTLAIMQMQAQAVATQTAPNPVLYGTAEEGLRSSLMAWMVVAGPKLAEAAKREAEMEEEFGQSVDDLIALIFSAPSATPEEAAAEEDAIRRAQGIL